MLANSIRWRIQLWHGGLLVLLVTTLTVGFYTYEKRVRLQIVDARLQEYLTPLLPTITGRGPGGGRPMNDRDRRPLPRDNPFGLGPGGSRVGRGPGGGFGPPGSPGGRFAEDDPMRERTERAAELCYFSMWKPDGTPQLISSNAPVGR